MPEPTPTAFHLCAGGLPVPTVAAYSAAAHRSGSGLAPTPASREPSLHHRTPSVSVVRRRFRAAERIRDNAVFRHESFTRMRTVEPGFRSALDPPRLSAGRASRFATRSDVPCRPHGCPRVFQAREPRPSAASDVGAHRPGQNRSSCMPVRACSACDPERLRLARSRHFCRKESPDDQRFANLPTTWTPFRVVTAARPSR